MFLYKDIFAPGVSGSPVLNNQGQVVGMIVGLFDWQAIAVRLEDIRDFLAKPIAPMSQTTPSGHARCQHVLMFTKDCQRKGG